MKVSATSARANRANNANNEKVFAHVPQPRRQMRPWPPGHTHPQPSAHRPLRRYLPVARTHTAMVTGKNSDRPVSDIRATHANGGPDCDRRYNFYCKIFLLRLALSPNPKPLTFNLWYGCDIRRYGYRSRFCRRWRRTAARKFRSRSLTWQA